MMDMIKGIIYSVAFISFVLLVILLNTTTPATAGPFGVLAIFIFAYLFLVGAFTYSIHGMSRLGARLSKVFMFRKPIVAMTIKRSYYYSTVLAASPVMLVGLQSVGEISIYEYGLVTIFAVLGCLYISKRVT